MTSIIKRCFILLILISSVLLTGAAGAVPQETAVPAIKLVRSQYQENASKAFIPKVLGLDNAELQAKINTNLESAVLAMKNPSTDSSLRGDFEISFYNGNLLGIHFRGSSFTTGGARPTKIDRGIHIDLTSGKIYELNELFKEDAAFEKRIKELCTENESAYRLSIEGLAESWTTKTFATSWTGMDKAFLLSADSVRVYSIPSNAMGAIGGYNVPYADLADILDKDGELWQKLTGRAAQALTVTTEESKQ